MDSAEVRLKGLLLSFAADVRMRRTDMSKARRPASANALPYKSPPPRPRPATPTPPKPRRIGIYIASGLLVYALTTYGTSLYWTLTTPLLTPLPAQDADLSSRYDTTAPHFDQDVSFIERLSGLTRLRRRLVSQAHGDVLEACVGTGRNALYYDIEKCRSVTFVDQSAPMVEIARKKWQALHPDFERAAFYTQSAQLPLPASQPSEGFTTVVQTMGVCSTPQPAAALAHLGSLAHPREGRVLLLEHGRSYYEWINWILDRSAARHADRHGCWFNRDVGEVVRGSGLVVERVERSQFGTVWYVEARPAGGMVGEGGIEEVATDTNGASGKGRLEGGRG